MLRFFDYRLSKKGESISTRRMSGLSDEPGNNNVIFPNFSYGYTGGAYSCQEKNEVWDKFGWG